MAESFAEVIPPHNYTSLLPIQWASCHVFFRSRTLLLEKKDMLKTWQNQMSPAVSRHMSVESFVEDIASPFLHILSPLSLRPVSYHSLIVSNFILKLLLALST